MMTSFRKFLVSFLLFVFPIVTATNRRVEDTDPKGKKKISYQVCIDELT